MAAASLLNSGCGAASPNKQSILPPEVEEGNIEYKLKLVNPTNSRFEHLVTQMKWRLQEGAGEAIYEIGVEDRGVLTGLTQDEMAASLETLRKMAERLGASVTVLSKVPVQPLDSDGDSAALLAAEVLVRKVPDDQQFIDIRIAVLGNVDAGKSTLLGVLSRGELDNGKGEARLNLFRHLHEIQTGRTSSLSHEIVGFGSDGQVLNFSNSKTSEDICENSSKVIHFIDVPGHQKYLKTAIFGMTGHAPHFAMLVISASTGVAGTAREHLGMALCLHVPIFIVVSKVDLCRQSGSGAGAGLERVYSQLEAMLRLPGCRRASQLVRTEAEAVAAACNFNQGQIVPIFAVSSVTGHNMDLLLKFLNLLPSSCNATEQQDLMQQPAEYQIDEVFFVPDVGPVVSGTLRRGVISVGEELWLGPKDDGRFVMAKVLSIHRNRLPCRVVQAGQAAAIALSVPEHDASVFLRKGMVLLSARSMKGVEKQPAAEEQPAASRTFVADVDLLFHHKSIQHGFRCTVHVGSVCQAATIEPISKDSLKTNDRARVLFRFERQPEYIVSGARLLFRQGLTRGVGQVVETIKDGIPKCDDASNADR